VLAPFLIMLREGVEAALIVAIIAGYLAQTGRADALGAVWTGVGAAVVTCMALGVAMELTASELPQKVQELFEAGVGLFAVVVLTGMVFWMSKASRSIRATVHAGVDHAFASGSGWRALAALAFFSVAREGLESILFLIAAWRQMDDVGVEAFIGAVLGLATAIAIGTAFYRGGKIIDLARFFRWTGVLILFVAAGIAAGVIRSLHEAGLWNGLQSRAFDASAFLPADGPIGTLLAGLFGYSDSPSQGEVVVWALYLVPALALFLMRSRPAPEPRVAASRP